MKTIAIMNMKGGVGKTTSAINLASVLAKDYGKRVLLIDADPQGNLSQFFKADTDVFTILDLLAEGAGYYPDAIGSTAEEHIDLIPANMRLLEADVSGFQTGLINLLGIANLRDVLMEDDAYDVILIDCPPAFSAGTMAALAAAGEVIIPVRLDAFSTSGMTELIVQVANMRKVNPDLRVAGVLLTMYRSTPACEEAEKFLREQNTFRVFDTVIRFSDLVGDSTFAQEALPVFSPRSAACVDYRRFVREYLEVE